MEETYRNFRALENREVDKQRTEFGEAIRKKEASMQTPTTLVSTIDIKTMSVIVCFGYIFAILYYARHAVVHNHRMQEITFSILASALMVIMMALLGLWKEKTILLVSLFLYQLIFMLMLVIAWGYVVFLLTELENIESNYYGKVILINVNAFTFFIVQCYSTYVLWSTMKFFYLKAAASRQYSDQIARFALQDLHDDLVVFDRSDSLLGTPGINRGGSYL